MSSQIGKGGNIPSRCLASNTSLGYFSISQAPTGMCPSKRSARIPPPAPANKWNVRNATLFLLVLSYIRCFNYATFHFTLTLVVNLHHGGMNLNPVELFLSYYETEKEAARDLKVDRTTLYRWKKTGEIPRNKIELAMRKTGMTAFESLFGG